MLAVDVAVLALAAANSAFIRSNTQNEIDKIHRNDDKFTDCL